MSSGNNRQAALILALAFILAEVSLGAPGGKTITTATNGLFRGEAAMGKDPVHPVMAGFLLRDRSGKQLWKDDDFGQNACWISGDGRSVVGLRSAGVEGQAGELAFYGDSGQMLRRVRVVNFSGGDFTGEGNLFICRTSDRGIAAYGRDGRLSWSVAAGSQFFTSGDGRWLAVVRNKCLFLFRDGRESGVLALDAPYLEHLRYDPAGAAVRFRTPYSEYLYDLEEMRIIFKNPFPTSISSLGKGQRRLTSANWPIDSIGLTHPLGNGWGEYQWYGGDPYLHPGIDVMALTDVGVPVYAVAHGWVKAWLTTSGTWHWRLAIADSGLGYSDSCDGWLYAHIDPNQPHLSVGDEVFPGDWIGHLVPWPVTGFDHLHFARIRDAGQVWGNAGADWVFQDSPLNHLVPNTDTEAPVIEQALAGSKFAFCRNNTSQYLPAGNLTGDVDIVARIYDRFGLPIPYYPEWEKLNPGRIEYAVHGPGGSVSRTTSFLFSHYLPYGELGVVEAVFKQDDSCVTYGDYDDRQYYYIVTNTDGDTALEASDTVGCWRTTDLPDGHYWVVVYASDRSENTAADSQLVTVNNYGGVAGYSVGIDRSGPLMLDAFPNPFTSRAILSINLSAPDRVMATIYNPLGERVASLAGGWLQPGRHRLVWDGRDEKGKAVPAGTYFVKAESNGGKAFSRLILLR